MTPLVEDATGNDLTYRIIGAAMTVHNHIGPGYKEEVYERALAVELERCGIAAERQHPVIVEYDGVPIYQFMLDLFVAGVVVVEVKAISQQVGGDELAQVLNCLKATQALVGLLFNFGRRSLQYRRIFAPRETGELRRTGRDNVKRKA